MEPVYKTMVAKVGNFCKSPVNWECMCAQKEIIKIIYNKHTHNTHIYQLMCACAYEHICAYMCVHTDIGNV